MSGLFMSFPYNRASYKAQNRSFIEDRFLYNKFLKREIWKGFRNLLLLGSGSFD
ncbi:hypothetical protein EDC32_1011249 [Laceyella sacchari]|jgi:hypothetical protein|nr:hypothetical protein EDC32_1011249 [Laceyella sacchari]